MFVTREAKEQHTKVLESVLRMLEKEGYRASEKKSKFHQKKIVWLGHMNPEDGIRSNEVKTEAIKT